MAAGVGIRRDSWTRGALVRLLLASVVLAYAVGLYVHLLHGDQAEAHAISPWLHWLRDSSLAVPVALAATWLGSRAVRRASGRRAEVTAALTTGTAYSVLAVPGNIVHARLFLGPEAAGHHGYAHLLVDAAAMVGPAVLVALAARTLLRIITVARQVTVETPVVVGTPVRVTTVVTVPRQASRLRRALAASLVSVLATSLVPGAVTGAAATVSKPPPATALAERCTEATAARVYDVRAIQVEIPYNRWGQTDPNGLMYALEQDVAAYKNWHVPLSADPATDPAGNRRLRPRPLVIRANEGECVKVTLTNGLPSAVLERTVTEPQVSLHVHGASYDVAASDGSAVGYNPDTTVARGESRTYLWRAPTEEGLFEFHDHGIPAGSQADGGSLVHGLYGALAVEPAGSRWTDPHSGLELYPPSNVATQSGDLYVDADIIPPAPAAAFRESVQLSQDEIPGIGFGFNYGSEPAGNREANLCPDCVGEETSLSSWTYGDPALVKLASGGLPVPAPTIEDPQAVRLVGWHPTPGIDDEEDCQSDTGVGGPQLSMPVVGGTRVPASCWTANVVHAYPNDPTKIRFGHVGPKETHVFHLHANQWLAEPRDVGKAGSAPTRPSDAARAESTTVDSQTYGPGDMFTADLLFGAGSRSGTVGDSIFHCHLYPHFADGFWALLRVHDVREDGRGVTPDGIRVRTLLGLPDRAVAPAPTAENPGYPRFIPGTFGWRAPQPPAATVLGPDGKPAPRVVAGQLLDEARLATTQRVSNASAAVAEVQRIVNTAAPVDERITLSNASRPVDAVQTITTTATSGEFRLRYGPDPLQDPVVPEPVLVGDDAAAVQVKLRAVAALSDVTVSTVAGGWAVTFPARDARGLFVHEATLPAGGTVTVEQTRTGGDGGTFRMKTGSLLGEPLPFDATAAQLELAVRALTGATDVTVATTTAPPGATRAWQITFPARDATLGVADSLTVGTSELVVLAEGSPEGRFTLSAGAATSAGLRFGSTAGDVDAALEALAGLPPVSVTTAAPGTWEVTFSELRDIPTLAPAAGDVATTVTTLTAGTDGGTFALSYQGETTGPIMFDAPATGAGSVEQRLEALVGITDVAVSKEAARAWRIEFADPARNVSALVASSSLASGGGAVVTVEANDLARRLATERDVLLRSNGGKPGKPGAPMVDPCPATITDPVTGATRPTREVTYDAAVIQTDIVYNEAGWHDTQGRIIVPLADVDAILAGTKKPEPLFIRVNAGDCINYNLTNMLPNWFGNDAFVKLTQTNMVAGHIHLVKFDVLGSDGSSNGWNYQQAAFSKAQHDFMVDVAANRRSCTADEAAGACRLPLPADYDPSWTGKIPGQTIRERWFADYELRTVFSHDHHFPAIDQNRGLYGALVVEPAGMDMRNPFTGAYYQPINDAAHGQVCGTACTGTATGTMMDIIGPTATDDFREYGVTIQDFVSLTRPGGNPQVAADTFNPPDAPEPFPDADPGVMAINYRNAPMVLRNSVNGQPVDPAYQFSSRVFGDPQTPLLQAYAGDPVRMRVVQGSQEEQHVLAVHGMRWRDEPDDPQSPLVASKALGISDAFNFEIPEMDCGVDEDCRGDYLYSGAATDDTWLGAWGIMRVFGKGVKHLLPLPDRQVQAANGNVNLTKTGTPPERANKPGTPCPSSAPVRAFQVVATDARITYNGAGDHDPYGLVYAAVRPGESVDAAVARARRTPEPMSIRANEGDCLEVTLVNHIDPQGRFATVHGPRGAADGDPKLPLEAPTGTPAGLRVSLHPQLVKYDVRGSDGATIGYNRDQTVAPGQSILYRWWADDVAPGELGAINLLDFGDVRGHRHHGLFAGLTIEPVGAGYHDPVTGAEVVDGQAVDVRVPGGKDFRDFTTFFQDGLNLRDAAGAIIHDPVDHPAAPGEPAGELDAEDSGEKAFNYRNEPFRHRLGGRNPVEATAASPLSGAALANVYSSTQHGDPATPVLRAYAGDPVRVRVLQGGDKPRQHVYQQGGHSWLAQPDDPGSTRVGASGGISVGRALNVHIDAAGGPGHHVGDHRYGCLVGFHHLSGGLWGITRVYAPPAAGALFQPDVIGVGGPDSPYRAQYHPIQPLERATIVARVYDDSNLDLQRGKEEVAVGGTEITVTARDGSGATQTRRAGSDGTARFVVAPGSYDVSTSVPANWTATTPTTQPADDIGDNGVGETSFGLVENGSAQLRLFDDKDGDGSQRTTDDPTTPRDDREPPLVGWTVALSGASGTRTVLTDGSGVASWDGLRPGSWSASVVAPAGWNSSRVMPVRLEVLERRTTEEMVGFNRKAGLSVHVFNDSDRNGTQLAGTESSLAGWELTVSGGPPELQVTVRATTDARGNATFDDPDPAIDGLRPGAYTISRKAPQPQWQLAGATASTDSAAPIPLDCGAAGCTTVLLEQTSQVVTLADHNDHSWVVAAPFNDVNNDGARQDGESKLVGQLWRATVTDASGTVVARDVQVGANGEVVLYPVTPGRYSLTMISPARSIDPTQLDWTSTNPGCRRLAEVDPLEPADSIRMACTTQVAVIAGERARAAFGFVQVGTIGVTVFQDFDRDGVEGEQARRLGGRTAYLFDESGRNLLQTRTTDADGMAAFKVSAGVKYQVQAVLPSGWAQTTPLAANGAAVAKVKVVAPTNALHSVEQRFGQYNTRDTSPPPDPTADLPSGTYAATRTVTLSSESNATFRFTLDGTAPSSATGMLYSGPITISTSRTLRAVAVDAAGNQSLGELTASYVIDRGAGTTTVRTAPTTWTVLVGGGVRGTMPTIAENLVADDDVRRVYAPAAVSGKAYVSDGYASLVLPAERRKVVALGVDYNGGASLAGASRSMWLYSWSSRKWEQLRPAETQPIADTSLGWDAAGDPARFVSPGGEVRVRVSATRSATFELRADQLVLTVGSQ